MMQAMQAAFLGKTGFVPYHASLFNRRYYENHFIPLKDNDDKVTGIMNIMHDVAHRIKAEVQLQKLNKSLEKKYEELEKLSNDLATFTYITSHDIKEPLRFVYTSLELLVKSEAQVLSNSSKANLRRMQGSLNRMNLLLDDIVTLAHISNLKQPQETVDLNEVLQQATNSLSKKVNEKRAVIECSGLPAIPGHKDMIVYLFTSLIDNAIKFQPIHNTPVISISHTIAHMNASQYEKTAETEYIKISFIDNGIGFEQQDAQRIFKMFEKLHDKKEYPGSGIGLTMCKKIMEAHSGFIEAIGTPEKGASFHCYFPVLQEE
jgi:light-regulated signal transduction histidine kinase (bacteriophytochrome)